MKPETEIRNLKAKLKRLDVKHESALSKLRLQIHDLAADNRRLDDMVELAKLFAPRFEQSDSDD